ncbi:MAG: HDIG domain-containing protein, partial [Spirochaetales bacterium]|nr:HDIG domain-containing protein [Spirochaetales bacterium]
YISKFLNYFIKVNCYYDVEQTKYNREMSTNKVQAVTDYYRNGEILIRKDFVVTSDLYKRVLLAEASIKRDTISKVLLVIGYVFILFAAGFILFSESFTQKKIKERDLILLLGVTLFYTLFSVLLKYFIYTKYSFLYPLILPTVLISMLVTFLLGNRFGVYLSVLYGFLILLITDFSIYSFTITLIVSILSTVIIHDVERRIDLIKASGELAILQTLLVLYMISVGLVSSSNILLTVIFSVSSSIISGILTLSLLPLFEHALRIPTCFQLAELCDLNAPLLKSMLIKAPGTYAHSISVANMAESAAQHIGANALLSKAGGYYHDIGKIDQPLYFIENQKGGKNLHDDMKPSLSVAVIKSHVKLGIEKAKKIGLPREIIDIIEQHHGKGSIMYFLDKAKKESKGNNILSEDFCYSGPNPASPEAAIVMLADSVEAAVRSLKNPTISQLEKFVWDLILNKLKDGMLDACGLTLSDLTTIKDSFINTLMGHYHSRIEYPTEVKKGE